MLRLSSDPTLADGNLVEPILALCSAGLAIWSGCLHRNVRVLVRQANGGASPSVPLAVPLAPTAADLATKVFPRKRPT